MNKDQIARKIIRELEILNGVKFGPESIKVVFDYMTAFDQQWLTDYEKLSRECGETEQAVLRHFDVDTKRGWTHQQVMSLLIEP